MTNTTSFAKWSFSASGTERGVEASTVMLGRQNERELLDRLLTGARSGRGGTIVIRGAPGIGKSTLLGYAMDSAAGFQVLRAIGNEAENDPPFAAPHQSCTPGLPAFED